MKYLLFLKEFYHKPTTKNYFLIIFFLLFILSSAVTFKIYSFKIINENYRQSFYIIEGNNMPYLLYKNENIKDIKKCVFVEDNIFVLEESLKQNTISAMSRIPNTKYNFVKNEELHNEVAMVSLDIFKELEFKNIYYVTLNNWMKYNEEYDFFQENNIKVDLFLYREVENIPEHVYDYLSIIIFIIGIIAIIIFIATMINIFIDERKYDDLYYILGFSSKKILIILFFKILSLVLNTILLNHMLYIFIKKILKLENQYNILIYIVMIFLMISLVVLNIVGRRFKYEKK